MSHCRKRSKDWDPELLVELEMKVNDSNADDDEVVKINNTHCKLAKVARKYQLSEKLQQKYCNWLQRIIK